MPNLKPPITTTAAAVAYRESILKALPSGSDFTPLMTLYLTDTTTPNEIKLASKSIINYAIFFWLIFEILLSFRIINIWRTTSYFFLFVSLTLVFYLQKYEQVQVYLVYNGLLLFCPPLFALLPTISRNKKFINH